MDALRGNKFDVMKIADMELLTIRGYNDELLARHASGEAVFIRQITQSTARVVRKRR